MAITNAAFGIRDRAPVAGCQRIESDIGSEIVEVRLKRSLRVVTVHLAVGERGVSHRKIKNAGVTAGPARRWLRKIAVAGRIDLQVNHWMLTQELSECDFPMQHRVNLQANGQLIDLKEWWIVR